MSAVRRGARPGRAASLGAARRTRRRRRHAGRAPCGILGSVENRRHPDAGTPMRVDHVPPVTPRDRMLVEWVAEAKVGDALPAPWSYASRPLESVVRTLAMLGVIERPAPGEDWASIARGASAAAQVWLEQHPADAGAPPR